MLQYIPPDHHPLPLSFSIIFRSSIPFYQLSNGHHFPSLITSPIPTRKCCSLSPISTGGAVPQTGRSSCQLKWRRSRLQTSLNCLWLGDGWRIDPPLQIFEDEAYSQNERSAYTMSICDNHRQFNNLYKAFHHQVPLASGTSTSALGELGLATFHETLKTGPCCEGA